MNKTGQLPIPLITVSTLFILQGCAAALEVILSVMHGTININLGVLGIFIGSGLLGLRPGWRTCALVFIWIGLIGIPLVSIIMLVLPGPLDLSILGQKVGQTPKELFVPIAVLLFCLYLWIYRVLTRHDIRKLFQLETANQPMHGTPPTGRS